MKKFYLGFVMLLAAASSFAFDQDNITLTAYASYEDDEFSNEINLTDMKAGDLAYVVCTLVNPSDSVYHGFEFKISLPEGYVLEPIYDEEEDESYTSKPLNEISRSKRWTYTDSYDQKNNTLKAVLFTLSPDKYSFPATTGTFAGPELFYFSIKCTDEARNDFAPIKATDIIFSYSKNTGEIDPESGKTIYTVEDHFFPNLYNLYYAVGKSKYATLCYESAIDFAGSDLKANVAKVGNDGYVKLTAVETVPAGAPVVISGETGSYMLTAKFGEVNPDAAFDGNELKGTPDAALTVEENKIYALAETTKGVGFYRCNKGVVIPRFKAYLESSSSADEFIFEETLGINNVETAAQSADVYTISGVKVEKAAQKGIYIVNGKKVVVK